MNNLTKGERLPTKLEEEYYNLGFKDGYTKGLEYMIEKYKHNFYMKWMDRYNNAKKEYEFWCKFNDVFLYGYDIKGHCQGRYIKEGDNHLYRSKYHWKGVWKNAMDKCFEYAQKYKEIDMIKNFSEYRAVKELCDKLGSLTMGTYRELPEEYRHNYDMFIECLENDIEIFVNSNKVVSEENCDKS